MLSCLIIYESRTPQGAVIYRDQLVEKPVLTIGRSSNCDIHLPDHSIHRNHAAISQANDGSIYLLQMTCIESEEESYGENHDNNILLAPGAKFTLGAYQFNVLPQQEGHHLVLSVAHIPAPVTAEAQQSDWLERLDKRISSYTLLGVIAFLFLLLPLLPGFSSALDGWQREWRVPLNKSWTVGQISRGHSIHASKCSVCHTQPFRPVSGQVCRDCHKDVSAHIGDEQAEKQGKIKVECSQCHLEHRAENGLILHDSALCTNCHGNLAQAGFKSGLENVRHFEKDHPAFSVDLVANQNERHGKRVALSDKDHLLDPTTLKFSHQVHLDKKGISSPRGDMVMACKDCHHLDASDEHFSPVAMLKDCQQSGCHKLFYDEPLGGKTPHGSVAEVVHNVKSFYLSYVANAQNFRAGGCTDLNGSPAEKLAACVNKATDEYLAATLFKATQGCGECHQLTHTDAANGGWMVAPVNVEHDWFPYSQFPHLKHRAIDCESCHDKRKSKHSDEVSMPDIQVCRTCHTSDVPRANKIANRCDSCHKFHTKTRHGKAQ